ncbi:putative C6 transcription factor [Aspergillus ibericus CBS 121593]|uniref:Fungal-specific transcription factor n=1 Tax=Aspergillus ibericus CBS 121593 TaxID=1448316 RepID=A0A395GIF1_9EURO|nr:fungal-specific transcription factor [Aspergillus ibericus CBS 121593]RAK95220.1 fungal-specific transcription factor [Aspergillus ibericus CBS 121593]
MGSPPKDRLAELEEKVNLILNGSIPARESGPGTKATQPSNYPSNDPYPHAAEVEDVATPQPSPSAIARAIDLYVEHCHRQPVWCFDFDGPGEPGSLPEELISSLLALTLRYLQEPDQGQHYADNAKTIIMLRIANGTVELATIESLCLLSYSSFIDGDMHVGQFYLGLASQLCRSGMLDVAATYSTEDPHSERKKRLFWSLQLLEQSYGRQTGLLRIPTEIWRPPYFADDGDKEPPKEAVPTPPPLPQDTVGCSEPDDTGIWSMSIQFGWVWSKVRGYVSDCASSRMREPWRHESMYSVVLSDLTEIENRTPLCHRYDHVQFYDRHGEELSRNLSYWVPWLKLQFMYHAILTVLNHPFLYIMASRHNTNLAIPNSFWRRSSELVVLHATWIVRLIDMVLEKEVRLSDPFFAHVAAIAATVQLYYCCAGDPRLKYKSRVDLAKCRAFLKTFATTSRACEGLHRILNQMMRVAAGSDGVNYETWVPSKIHLSIPLMWDILQFHCTDQSAEGISDGRLLHPSLAMAMVEQGSEEASTLEVIVTTSPEVTVNTADGGQAVPLPLYPTPAKSKGNAGGNVMARDRLVAPIDSLMVNTPWLWTDAAPLGDIDGSLGYDSTGPAIGDAEFSSWWNLGNL